tara:strand:- start:9771 stop:10106 length:336 start_codon:yes stop_codon:yes gene_type:complete
MVETKIHAFTIHSEDTKKFYFKDGNSGMDIDEAALGFYAKAVDKAHDDDVLCFYSTSKNKHGDYYYPEKHYVVKHVIKPFMENENYTRYTVRIKYLKKYDMKKIFKRLREL